jgi:hypothetical protein
MVVVFGKSFTDFCKPRFDISESLVRQAFTYPDKEQNLLLQGLKIRLYLKKMDKNYLLIQSILRENIITIHLAFWIKPELVSQINNPQPLDILGAFISVFGLTITVGQEQGKFLYNLRKLMKIPKDSREKILNVSIPRNHEFLESRLFRTSRREDGILFEGALVYYINVTEYLKWIGK